MDAGGGCLWRELRQVDVVSQNALSALGVGQDATALLPESDGTALLPVREIPAEVVRQHLRALAALHPGEDHFEEAVYADEAGRTAWRVIVVTGTLNDGPAGVVLVEERRTGRWRALYEEISAYIPLAFSMVVAGNTLTAALCTTAGSWECTGVLRLICRRTG